MSSGPEGQQLPSPQGRIDDGICSDSCVIQDTLTLQAGPYMTTPSLVQRRDIHRDRFGQLMALIAAA